MEPGRDEKNVFTDDSVSSFIAEANPKVPLGWLSPEIDKTQRQDLEDNNT